MDFYYNFNKNEDCLILEKRLEILLNFELQRTPNFIDNQSSKDDFILDKLSHMDLTNEKLDNLKEITLQILKFNFKREIFWAFLGYLYYIEGDFKKSIKCFFKTIEINFQNVDNWIDLGFAYRAYGDFQTSDFLFLNYEKIVKQNFQGFDKFDGGVLSQIIKKVNKQ